VPRFNDPQSRTNPIDAFLLAKLSDKGLSFSPAADRATLIRRVTFDLIGLPPTPEEVDAFVNDKSADAYQKLVQRLLASPQYGERWGRHWLDVAGYADSEGGSPEDPLRSNAWKYRDYVIRSFNADKPFDRFIREQIAGDELVKPLIWMHSWQPASSAWPPMAAAHLVPTRNSREIRFSRTP
jgi:hypothetical protein